MSEFPYTEPISEHIQGYQIGFEDGKKDGVKSKADAIDLIDRHMWNYSHEVWEDFKPILEQLKGE